MNNTTPNYKLLTKDRKKLTNVAFVEEPKATFSPENE